jgi:hypothetical protein
MSLQHRKDHYKEEDLLGMQEIYPFLDLCRGILNPHQEAAHCQPTHDKQGHHQPVVGPKGDITMDAGNDKGSGIQPDMIDKELVKIGLYIFQAVTQTYPFRREVDICGKEKDHAQVTCASCKIVIGIVGINDRQQQESANEHGPFPEWPLTKQFQL